MYQFVKIYFWIANQSESSIIKFELILMHQYNYSKASIIKPGRSRLLEFEKKIVLLINLIDTFSKYPEQVV